MNPQILTVITVNFHSQSLIHQMEKMLAPSEGVTLIVVDNSGEFRASAANTRVVRSGANLGFGKACNLGASHAESELLLFLNPDASVSLEVIYDLTQRRPAGDNAIWGPAILDRSGRAPTLMQPGRLGLLYRRTYLHTRASYKGCEVLYVSGACMMTSARAFAELGGFCEDIFLYAEDLELCTRASRHGTRCLVFPDLEVQHMGGRSSAQLRARLMRLIRSWRGHYRFLSASNGRLAATVNAIHLASGVRL